MWKIIRFMKNAQTALATASAVFAAAIVAVETYRELRDKVNGSHP